MSSDIKIAILTEASKDIGYGHLIRCSVIYEKALQLYPNSKFIVNTNEDITLFNNLFYKKDNWKQSDFKIDADIIILDSYNLTSEILKNLQNQVKQFFYINDKDINFNNDVISLRFAIEAKDNHKQNELFGTKYFPIRKNFKNIKRNQHTNKTNNILVMFGGTDIRQLSITLKPLYKKYSTYTFHIITANISIYEQIKDIQNVNAVLNPDWDSLARLMINSYIAIASGGTVLYELAYLCIPTIAISVIDNQQKGIKEFVAKGFIKEYFKHDDINLLDKIDNALNNYISEYQKYYNIASNGKIIIDGDGDTRLIEDITSIYKNRLDNK